MCPYKYYHIMRNCKDKKHLRYQVVTYADKHGIKPAAKIFHAHPNTVRKWLYRFKELGYPGLEDTSRRPGYCQMLWTAFLNRASFQVPFKQLSPQAFETF